MEMKRAIENLNRLKKLGILRGEEEYDRFLEELNEIHKNNKINEAPIREIDEMIALEEIKELLG